VRTYHVSPKGRSLIENLRWRDGREIPKSMVYALVIDGDFFYPGRALPSIASVAAGVLVDALVHAEKELYVSFRRYFKFNESMSFVEMFRWMQGGFREGDAELLSAFVTVFRYRGLLAESRGGDLEFLTELAGFWRLASAHELHRRDLKVQHLREKACMGRLDTLYPSDVEALPKEIPTSFTQNHGVTEFLRAKYSFLPENCVQRLAAEIFGPWRRSE
jgi:hypothetical protein